jgi:hypothetical protein
MENRNKRASATILSSVADLPTIRCSCFEDQSRDFWHGELRPGDAHTAAGVLDLLEACFAKLPAGMRSVIVGADKGFYDHRLVELLEARKASFVIVARLTGPIKRRLAHLRYTTLSPAVEVAEFRYQPSAWRRGYRFVVVRRLQAEEPSEQLTLFTLGRCYYQVLVANLTLQPLNLWRLYNDRAGIELVIRQLKRDYALGHIPTRHFFANEVYFHLLLLAYNLINWFKRLCCRRNFTTQRSRPCVSRFC